jgi:trk system potassium uptake protein TrkH
MGNNPLGQILGFILIGVATLMLLPALVDLAQQNPDWHVFLFSAATVGVLGVMLTLATQIDAEPEITIRRAFVITATCWFVLPAVSALPFVGVGLNYTDAFFEAMSGVTTTGSTILTGLDALPPGILLWRSLLQWIGGVGIIVMAIIMLPFLRIGGMQLFSAESSETGGKIVPNARQLVEWIAGIYVALTSLCAVLYALGGMSAFDAFCHAMATLSTGGYSTHDASFAFFQNPYVQWIAIVFMIAGAFPFAAYIRTLRGDRQVLFHHPEARVLVLFLLVTSGGMAVWLSWTHHMPLSDSFRLTAFNITSIVTTTGFANADYTGWGPQVVGVFFLITLVGGCTGSTSGAIKIFRYLIVVAILRRHLKRLTSPRRVLNLRYGNRRVPEDIPNSVLAFLTAFFGVLSLFTVVLTMLGLDFVTALSAAATAITNVGPGLGPIIGPTGNFAPLPDAAKWVLSAAMLLGRLELFAVLVLFDPDFWR